MRFGLLFVALGGLMAWPALAAGGLFWVFAWPAVSFALVGIGYLGLGARVLGKRRDGSLPLWARVLHAPYLLAMVLGWHVLRWLEGEACWNEVVPGVYVGRRCPPDELPDGVTAIVDMTAEWTRPRGLPETARYFCLPTLDGHVPSEAEFHRLLDELAALEGPVYVHCAAGHGRSATAAAALLIRRGLVTDPDEALALMRESRPRVHLMPRQRLLAGSCSSSQASPSSQAGPSSQATHPSASGREGDSG